MVKRSKKFISIVMTLAVVSGFTFTCIPAYETKAATSVSVNESETYSSDIMTAMQSETATYSGTNYGLCDNIQDGTILHCWSWSCNTIKANMKDIAEAGYTAVQTSPINNINESCTTMKLMGNSDDGSDGAWWWYYQPTNWKIGNYVLGSRDDFKAMCAEAEKYGIKVIVDVVPNHTTGNGSKVSQELINVAGGWDKLYHSGYNQPINDYNDRYQCTLHGCSNGGLYDVNTENPDFQKYFVEYLNDCIDCGADGFRYDTAKHIGLPSDPVDSRTSANGWRNNFWSVATGKESVGGVTLKDKDRIFNYGEVLQDRNCKETEYAQYVSLTASSYGDKLRDRIRNKSFNSGDLLDWSHPTNNGRKLVTWVESHDTYCNEGASAWMNDWQIRMCWAVIAAREDGTPLFFSRPDGSNGWSNRWGKNVLGAKGNDQFKDPEVVAVNQFRNAMVGQNENMTNYGSNQVLAIERGTGKNAGVTIINLGEDKNLNGTSSNLADGTYYDKVYNQKFVVSGGKFTEGTAKGGKITVLYEGKNIRTILKASKESSTFTTDSIDITLSAQNCTNAKYKIGDKAAEAFTDGQSITLGAGLTDGESIKLTLTATDAEGNPITETYTYKKKVVVYNAGYLYADKVSGWGDMYVYVYNESSGSATKIAEWPGVKMTYNSEVDRYEYKLPEEYQTAKTQVIFTDGNNQVPASREPGKYFEAGKAMHFDGKSIALVNPTENKIIKLSSDAISFDKVSPQEEGTAIKITTASATDAIGTVSYQFEINGEVVKSYSSSKTFNWTPNEAGNYTIKVIAKDSKGQASATASYKITEKIVVSNPKFTSTTITSDNTNVGTPVKISANATGGEGTLKYRFVVQKSGKSVFTQDYSTKKTVTWTPKEAGTYKVYYKVKDGNNSVIMATKTYTVKSSPITITPSTSVSEGKVGEVVNLSVAINGSTSGLKYRFVAQKDGKTTFAQNYSTKKTAAWTPKEAGTYKLYFKVKDSAGKITTKTMSLVVKDAKPVSLTDVKFSKESPQAVRTTIKITATGKSSADNVVYYKVSVHEGVNGWKTLKNYSTTNYVNWKPSTKGTAYVMVEVMDSAGDYDYQMIPYTIK